MNTEHFHPVRTMLLPANRGMPPVVDNDIKQISFTHDENKPLRVYQLDESTVGQYLCMFGDRPTDETDWALSVPFVEQEFIGSECEG